MKRGIKRSYDTLRWNLMFRWTMIFFLSENFVHRFGETDMLLLKMAFRNVFRQRRRSILTALTMLGGFALASISFGWADGTYGDIIDMFTRNRLGHVQVHKEGYLENPSLYKTIENYTKIGATIGNIGGVEAWAPRVFSAGLLSVGDESSAARVIGIAPQHETTAVNFHKKVAEGSLLSEKPSHQAMIGRGLAKVLGAHTGEELVIVSQAADGSIANDAYTIVGIIQSGDEVSDRMSCYLHLHDAQQLFALGDQVHEIVVIAEKSGMARSLSEEISAAIDKPELSVEPWQVFARSFYDAMQADKQGMYIFLFVIILIVAVGVLNTVLMAVLERRREYGLLKALGNKPKQIFALILYEVNILALLSIAGGIIVGLIANYILSIYGFSLPEPISYGGMEFKEMHSEINFRSYYIPALTVLLTATIVGLFPALKAAKTDPAVSMRRH
ncbi:MAG: FtsX-like permease family protein [Chitinivibrionales bacterium]|nr:FtsX-like permease family protein [Chitinivibrionales bacterium]